MNRAALHAWKNLTDDGSVRWLKYSFGPGTANTLAVRLDDGGWLVVCPASGAPLSVLDELAQDGPVRALLAPNAYHHLGQRAWRARFPEAVSYASKDALPRLSKKSPEIEYRPVDELREAMTHRVSLFLPEGLKAPDLLIRVSAGGSTLWWMGELFSNSTVDDQIWLLRILARFAGSGLGYRRNTKPGLVYVRDPAAWIRSIRQVLEAHPPSVVLPAHGDPVLEEAALRTQPLVRDLP